MIWNNTTTKQLTTITKNDDYYYYLNNGRFIKSFLLQHGHNVRISSAEQSKRFPGLYAVADRINVLAHPRRGLQVEAPGFTLQEGIEGIGIQYLEI